MTHVHILMRSRKSSDVTDPIFVGIVGIWANEEYGQGRAILGEMEARNRAAYNMDERRTEPDYVYTYYTQAVHDKENPYVLQGPKVSNWA